MNSVYEFDVHLPSSLEPGRTYPAIFTLHGKGSNERNMHGLVESLSDDFIIIGIRGNLRLGAGYQYYELKSLGNPVRDLFDQAAVQLEAFIKEATTQYPIDPQRRYLLGFSQGAILAMTLALTMGNGLRGVVALNGYVPGFVKDEYPLQSVEQVAFFISHGEYDSVFPVSIGYENEAYFRELTPKLTFKTYKSDHGVTEENQRDFLQWIKEDARGSSK
ncbi:alpha/beta hydrolase [Paenibacillus glycanilyticus]|uniref:alpha/beta hydrolase n=1 Tax=Paenibacillus glycanilyticus TaxID=126569 RepID=UPI00191009CE|nr:alpha/beta hydrolase-fold protein [Paenibacillus glycanilyticus]